jgi:Transposase IS116/IS110/IS902 family
VAERGCGPLTAAKPIGEIAGADRFATDAKLARSGGAAPIPASSGNTNRPRLDRGGNRQLNCALHRLAVNKGTWDPETAAYLARKQAEGKSRKEALRCLKRILARRVWKLLRSAAAAKATPVDAAVPARPRAADTVAIEAPPYLMPCVSQPNQSPAARRVSDPPTTHPIHPQAPRRPDSPDRSVDRPRSSAANGLTTRRSRHKPKYPAATPNRGLTSPTAA